MKVLYLGCFCEPTISTFIKECTKGVITVSATTFQKALLEVPVSGVISPDISYPASGLFPVELLNTQGPSLSSHLPSHPGIYDR